MNARKTLASRERRRFELRQEAKASRTLRKYGFCEADIWTREEAAVASELLRGLTIAGEEQKQRLLGQGRHLDGDSYLWGTQEPDYVGQLAREVARVAGDGRFGKALCERVAARLLDRERVRVATAEESAVAAMLLDGIDPEALMREGALAQRVVAKVEELVQSGAVMSREQLRGLAGSVAERISVVGCWDGKLTDEVPPEMQPLHMPAVRESLGSLIPAVLHATLDKAAARVKDAFGPVCGGSVLFMDRWQVSVRAEDALARGALQEDALEFFLLVLRRLCKVMELPVAIASKTVGIEIGR